MSLVPWGMDQTHRLIMRTCQTIGFDYIALKGHFTHKCNLSVYLFYTFGVEAYTVDGQGSYLDIRLRDLKKYFLRGLKTNFESVMSI